MSKTYDLNTLSPDEIWTRVRETLKDIEDPSAYKMWLSDIKSYKLENNTLFLIVPGLIHEEIIEKRYVNDFKTIINGLFDLTLEIKLICDKKEDEKKPETNINYSHLNVESTALNPTYTFDNFVVGSSNRHAHAAAFAVAERPAKAYNPLFIHGGSGLGKTHLIHAVGNYIRKNYPELKIIYVTSEQFTNEFINCIREKTNEEFRNKYRLADVLMVDDIQFIADKESTQEEFFHTFNALHSDMKQIILTSDRPAREITRLEERLRTRFDWGVAIDIQPPDYETRAAILKTKAEALNIDFPDSIYGYIAENVKSNIRELEGVLNRLRVYTRLEGKNVTYETVDEAIYYYKNENSKIITPDLIIENVIKYFSISRENILSKRRTSDLVEPRYIAMYLIREYTNLSTNAIGKIFERDHSTVISGLKSIDDKLNNEENRNIKSIIAEIKNNIECFT